MKTDYLKVNDDIKLYLPRMTFAPAIFKLIDSQRDYLSPYVPMATFCKTEKEFKKILKTIQITNQSKRSLITYLFYQEELIGSIGFIHMDHKHASAELGYWLSADFQGRGIISTSCQRLIDYGFKHLDLHRICVKIIPDNEKSLRVPERLGFEKEGVLREAFMTGERFYDLAIFSLLRPVSGDGTWI